MKDKKKYITIEDVELGVIDPTNEKEVEEKIQATEEALEEDTKQK